jgi:hypothetical protein
MPLAMWGQDIITRFDTSVYMFHPYPSEARWGASDIEPHITPCYCMQQYYAPDTITIYGVAITLRNRRDSVDLTGGSSLRYTALLMQEDDSIPPFYDTEWGYTYHTFKHLDSLRMHDSTIKKSLFRYDINTPSSSELIKPCYEFYFNTPMKVNRVVGSFFVGRVCGEHWVPVYTSSPLFLPYEYGLLYPPSSGGSYFWRGVNPANGALDTSRFAQYNIYPETFTLPRYTWGWAFPIIGFHCNALPFKDFPVTLTATGDNSAVVTWPQYEEGLVYDLRLTSQPGGLDSIITTTDTTLVLQDLPAGNLYFTSLRKHCRYATVNYDTLLYSPWIEGPSFGSITHDTTGGGSDTTHSDTTAIAVAGNLDFALGPNPAHEKVNVVLLQEGCDGSELVLCDITGRELRRYPVETSRTTLDISSLPAGVYLFRLLSPQGTGVRRLVVE